MSNQFTRIGKSAAVITSLILFALLINIHIINAKADDGAGPLPKIQIHEKRPASYSSKELESASASEPTEGKNETLGHLAKRLNVLQSSRPIAYYLGDRLYVVDGQGKILGTADSLHTGDLPVISGRGLKLDSDRRCIAEPENSAVLALLSEFEDIVLLKPLVSGISVKNGELIAYMNFGRIVPVIFGHDHFEEKTGNLIEYYRQLGADELTRRAKYLDLRVEDRVVVKKNV
ncbi:MAG: cell division protein FtsQ [Calditrichaeota bacterium]|nr:MAG: cell division protein FtsQ [Calditrichota bacterium]